MRSQYGFSRASHERKPSHRINLEQAFRSEQALRSGERSDQSQLFDQTKAFPEQAIKGAFLKASQERKPSHLINFRASHQMKPSNRATHSTGTSYLIKASLRISLFRRACFGICDMQQNFSVQPFKRFKAYDGLRCATKLLEISQFGFHNTPR
ncbi:uncharacterized protein LY89DRAFT_106883 [Mollisia scopiformis]|uniref:Uncharacterized protein n=1 Tax=Mollisia scopiformis TaxID=149040 RepID=A0A194X591_MOLSC|nr:uncharacterized protein LY89DRAFT_106883 [Mollisia scopiformis]KUJ15234.1 hypothetical protein LY89DRAFT_106883 [Mollisia scopiformis]